VLATSPGWLGGGEVVEVTFDPAVISYGELLDQARARDCAAAVWTRSDEQQELAAARVGELAKRSDQAIRVEGDKYYLAQTALRHVPMTATQAARVHATLGKGGSLDEAERWLSERQLGLRNDLLAAGKEHPDQELPVAVGLGIVEAWERAEAALEDLEEAHEAPSDGPMEPADPDRAGD